MLNKDMTEYTEEMGKALTSKIEESAAKNLDTTNSTAEAQLNSLRALVKALESGMLIVKETHYGSMPREPYPGACKIVVEQCLSGIALARKSRLIP